MFNTQVINYNLKMGYTPHSEQDEQQVYELTKENYFSKGRTIRKAVMSYSKDDTPFTWDDTDFSSVTKAEKQHLYSNLHEYIQQEVDKRI